MADTLRPSFKRACVCLQKPALLQAATSDSHRSSGLDRGAVTLCALCRGEGGSCQVDGVCFWLELEMQQLKCPSICQSQDFDSEQEPPLMRTVTTIL